MQSQLITKEYKYIWPNDNMRYALIYLRWDETLRKYVFQRCDYFGLTGTYKEDDWAFLKDLATEVLHLAENGGL
jgi:hypothetical protein